MQDDADRPQFVGFYWTYPVKWAGFTELSADPDEAARQSRTIRYQRVLAERYVRERRGIFVDEVVLLEPSRDYVVRLKESDGKEKKDHPLLRRLKPCKEGIATLLWVDFGRNDGWRSHRRLHDLIHALDIRSEALDPIPWKIDGEDFEPAVHFRDWRELDKASDAWRQMAIPMALPAILDRVPEGRGRNRTIAEYLNDLGVPTKTGLPWTPDTVKHAINKLISQGGG
ncbi:recombinase family protein [Microvirga calopogonii]|uniref:recombinase family protein n=1 Tax=Microvirga calopogonii TaxID=2078013 RepID=UPI000E0CED4F|nr:recombinase family protein [Microvirga calopogonii]